MIKRKEKEHFVFTQREKYIRGISKMGLNKGMEHIHGVMEISLLASSKMG